MTIKWVSRLQQSGCEYLTEYLASHPSQPKVQLENLVYQHLIQCADENEKRFDRMLFRIAVLVVNQALHQSRQAS